MHGIRVSALAALAVLSLRVCAAEYWVDPQHAQASDGNPGTEASPARGKGSSLDIQAFARGDVDGDGKVDVRRAE